MSILLDTTVLVDVLRGRRITAERLTALRQHGDVPFTTPISVEEIHRGLRDTERAAASRLFDGLRIAPIGRPEGVRPAIGGAITPRRARRWRRRTA